MVRAARVLVTPGRLASLYSSRRSPLPVSHVVAVIRPPRIQLTPPDYHLLLAGDSRAIGGCLGIPVTCDHVIPRTTL